MWREHGVAERFANGGRSGSGECGCYCVFLQRSGINENRRSSGLCWLVWKRANDATRRRRKTCTGQRSRRRDTSGEITDALRELFVRSFHGGRTTTTTTTTTVGVRTQSVASLPRPSTRLTADGSFYCARWSARTDSCRLSSANYFRADRRAVALEQQWKKTYRSPDIDKGEGKPVGTMVSTLVAPCRGSRNLEKKLSLSELIKGK